MTDLKLILLIKTFSQATEVDRIEKKEKNVVKTRKILINYIEYFSSSDSIRKRLKTEFLRLESVK